MEIATPILESTGNPLSPVREQTIYPAQFPILLRQRLQGKSIAQAAELLDIPPEHVERLLAGLWRPSKRIRRKMGLEVVYALAEPPAEDSARKVKA